MLLLVLPVLLMENSSCAPQLAKYTTTMSMTS
jgi:hypothetical protein